MVNKMIKHIVLLQFKSGIDSKIINEVLNKLGNLRYTSIPQIEKFIYGENNSPEQLNKNFNYGFIMEFKSNYDRDVYLSHPDHQNLASIEILPLLQDGGNSVVVLDFNY